MQNLINSPGLWFNSALVGPLAQLVEQETLNLLVEGSSPSRPTSFLADFPAKRTDYTSIHGLLYNPPDEHSRKW